MHLEPFRHLTTLAILNVASRWLSSLDSVFTSLNLNVYIHQSSRIFAKTVLCVCQDVEEDGYENLRLAHITWMSKEDNKNVQNKQLLFIYIVHKS